MKCEHGWNIILKQYFNGSKMENELKEGFDLIKPLCDNVMVRPNKETITIYLKEVLEMKQEVVQELQQYLLFPFLTHITAAIANNSQKTSHVKLLVDGMRWVVGIVQINSFELCMKIEYSLLQIIFDKNRPGMLADISEELKYSVLECLTVMLLNTEVKYREMMVRTQVPLLAQAVFVAVHIAKLEKSRPLRLAAINCLLAHTGTHPCMTENYHITTKSFEKVVVDMLASILPGVISGLQDVATAPDNPGHGVILAALDATHRMLCVVMRDAHAPPAPPPRAADFLQLARRTNELTDVSSQKLKDIEKRSPEWYKMAAEKLSLVTRSLSALRTHEHFKVRRQLAILYSRIIHECSITMQPSFPIALEVLIGLSNDDYPEVSNFCKNVVSSYLDNPDHDEAKKNNIMDSLCDNFFNTLETLPSVLNNINSSRKLYALNLLYGYAQLLSSSEVGGRAWGALGDRAALALSAALANAATMHHALTLLNTRPAGVTSDPPQNSPWCQLQNIDDEQCLTRLKELCGLLGGAPVAHLVVDRLLDMLLLARDTALVFIINYMASGPNSSPALVRRVLSAYLSEEVWCAPLEVRAGDAGHAGGAGHAGDTLDVTVYDPRAWHKDSVPGLYEGATEVRYTDISYEHPRVTPTPSGACSTLADAQKNMTLVCLLTEGVGLLARRLGDQFQPYLIRTLCLILERVGSQYQMLHLAGLKAINDIAFACGHASVAELIGCNADYFTHQITVRLKKAWNCESALQILSVVMEFSDPSIQDYLYAIVQDVLVQSCDKYYEKYLYSYLQVFMSFIECVRKWFNIEDCTGVQEPVEVEKIDLLKDVIEYDKHLEEERRLLNETTPLSDSEEDSEKTPEDLYKDYLKDKEDSALDYDDKVSDEKPPLPQHVSVTVSILQRCLHFVSASQRQDAALALELLRRGLLLVAPHEDQLLPLVHSMWEPLVTRLESSDAAVLRRAFDLLFTMAAVSKDFIQNRSLKDILPFLYKFLSKSSKDSYLKDAGSAYRNSHAYRLQLAALDALPLLVTNLGLQDQHLEDVMFCVDAYLSNKQPKPLQTAAVKFFKILLDYDYGSVWYHLRGLCCNQIVLKPPNIKHLRLQEVSGTPYTPIAKEYAANITLIFEDILSKE